MFIFQSCSSSVPTLPVNNDQGNISVSLEKYTFNKYLSFIKLELSNSEFQKIEKGISINNDSFTDIKISNIPLGMWNLLVEVYDNNENLIFEGNVEIEIISNGTSALEFITNPYTQKIIITESSIRDILNSIVAIYPFSGNANDYSGNGLNGKSIGPVLTKDIFGKKNTAYYLDGINDYIEIPHDDKFNNGQKTIMFWLYKENNFIRDTPGLNDVEGIIFKSWDTGYDRDFSFGISNQQPPFDIYLVAGTGMDKLLEARAPLKLYPKTWYHVIGMIDNNSLKLFINGELITETKFEGKINFNDSPIIIGKASNSSFSTRFFNGIIDDLIILDKSLNNEEVKQVYSFVK